MPLFKPGQSGNLQGRPKGAKDHRQFSLTFWFNLILADYSKLKPSQRSKIALDCWKTLVTKAKSLPADPEDSSFNAEEAMISLKEIESRLQSKSDNVTDKDGSKRP